MVTTSDDKSLRVWEWDIPVDIKYIADPAMHSMPSVAVHPSGQSRRERGAGREERDRERERKCVYGRREGQRRGRRTKTEPER